MLNLNIVDFVIGALFMNAMPHLVIGLTKTHFLGLFGYSAKGNIAYAFIQFFCGVMLYGYNYGFQSLFQNAYLLGGLSVLLAYFLLGKFMVAFYAKKKDTN